ncbi:MAG TPA: hypothetical protein VMZ03_01980 [Chitinophagaceae bacterium]|nr:hypothetical protein [Chitinophagaceae bacterium]
MRKSMAAALVIGILFSQSLQAQYYYFNNQYYESAVVFEVGLSGGIMNSLNDLGGKKGIGKNFIKDLRWKTARPSYGGYIMATYKNAIAGRIEGTFGEVVGYDSILKNVASSTSGRYERNLSFRSRISEVQLAIEVHPLFFKSYEDEVPPSFSPYVVVGAGYFSFDPEAKLGGQWFPLAPLRLEGQGFAEYPDRKPYDLKQVNVLGGVGLKYEINSMLNARLEIVYRKLFTDYLDDASTDYIDASLFATYLTPVQAAIAQQLYFRRNELNASDVSPLPGDQRGDPSDKDSYFTIQAKIGITFGRKSR